MASKWKKKWFLSFKSKSESELNAVQENDKLRSRFTTIDTNHSENKKYLHWMEAKKKLNLNITQKISNRSELI